MLHDTDIRFYVVTLTRPLFQLSENMHYQQSRDKQTHVDIFRLSYKTENDTKSNHHVKIST